VTNMLATQAAPTPLLRIEEARRLLAECVRVDEVKDIRDKAQAIAAYYRERDASLEMQNDAAEVRLRAERRLGDLLKAMPKNEGGRPTKTGTSEEPVSTLGEIGITKKQSSVWQRIAALAEEEFEERIADAKENGLELTTSRVLRSKPPAEMQPRPSRNTEAPPPIPPPVRSGTAEEPDDFSDPGHVSSLIFEALAPVTDLYERWPSDLRLRPLINMVRERLERFQAWEAAREKRRRENDAA
jgi:hypothetical protein